MLARLLLVAAVAVAAAFAPAPLPKKQRANPDRLSLERIQGVWVVEKVESSANGRYQRTNDPLTEVHVEGGRWIFISGQARSGPVGLKIDATKAPAWFDLGEPNSSQTSGLMRLRGGQLQVLYQWGRPRPGSFESPPDGYWLITFRR